MSAPTVVATGFAPNTPTTVHTYVGTRPNSRGCIVFGSFVNVGAATELNLRIVPAGETITEDDWCVIPKDTVLNAVGSDESTGVFIKDDVDKPSHVLMTGDRIVVNAGDADRVAMRVCVQELAP